MVSMKLLASLAVVLLLASATGGDNVCSEIGVGEVECDDPSKQLCGIDRGTGNPLGCVSDSQCPAGTSGFPVTCDATSAFCCCEDKYPGLICNELWNQNDDTVWKQACSLPELSGTPTCNKSWTTTPPPPPPPACMKYNARGQRRYVPCTDPFKPYCGIERQTGSVVGCVAGSECPASWFGFDVVCDLGSPYCCCRDSWYSSLKCNDILSENDDTIWKRACGLPELKSTPVCQQSWTTTTPPPPMPQHCVNYCNKKRPQGVQGNFTVRCGDRDRYQLNPHCPRPCPRGCDRHCQDGENMECPDQGPSPPEPVVIDTGGAPTAPVEKKDEGLGAGEIVGIVLGALILLLIIGVAVYFLCIKDKKQAPSEVPYSGAGEPQAQQPPEVTPQSQQQPQQQYQYQPPPQEQLPPAGWYPRQEGLVFANPGTTQGYTQSTQFAPQPANQFNYQQGATSSMPNMRYQ